MVDQAQVAPPNGRTELPTREVARSGMDFLHDVATLAELQEKLVLVDLREGLQKLVMPVALAGVGMALAVGAVPIFLAAIALTIAATTSLAPWVCVWIALLVGVVLALLVTIPSLVSLKHGLHMFDRSYTEWRRNFQWVKDSIKRAGRSGR
jgi:hypothetical protein